MLNWIHSWLAREDPLEKADLLFVLAGRQSRKEHAVKLFHDGWSRRILFSVGRFEIRRFPKLGLSRSPDLLAMAKSTSPPERHYFVSLHDGQFEVQRIPVRWLGTLSEIDALADWLEARPEISSLLIVSSDPHLRRLRLCCRTLLPAGLKIHFRAAPQENLLAIKDRPESEKENQEENEKEDKQKSQRSFSSARGTSFELLKLVCYSLFLPVWRIARRWRSRTMHSLSSK
jgi:hypothetical protein